MGPQHIRRRFRAALAGPALAIFLLLNQGVQAQAPANLGDLKQQLTEYKRSGAYDSDVAAAGRCAVFVTGACARRSKETRSGTRHR